MNRNIDLTDIKAFVTIANSKSFTKAAEVLNVSRGHLSRQLKKLEEELHVQLLIRTTRSLKLTDEGKAFFIKCNESLIEIDSAIYNVINKNEALNGKININCVGGIIGEEIVSKIIAKFSIKYPQIEVNLDFSSDRVDLIENNFNLVIRMGSLEDSGLIARKLTDLSIDTLASPKYLKPNSSLKHPKDLSDYNCLTGTVKKWTFEDIENSNNTCSLNVNGNYTCKNGRSLITMAINGVGIIRVPTIYCQKEIKAKKLIPVFNDWKIKTVPLFLLYHKNPNQPERLSKLIDFFMKNFPR